MTPRTTLPTPRGKTLLLPKYDYSFSSTSLFLLDEIGRMQAIELGAEIFDVEVFGDRVGVIANGAIRHITENIQVLDAIRFSRPVTSG